MRPHRVTLLPMSARPPAAAPVTRRSTRGFTLVEQIAVLAVAGTVSATALPALVALDQQARDAALASLAASAASAMALNQAGCMVTAQRTVPGKCQPVRDCVDVDGLLMVSLPAGYAVLAQPLTAQAGSCSLLRLHDGSGARFYGVATGS